MPNYVVPDPGQAPPFERTSEYDSLGLLLNQVLEGPSGDGIVHAMVGQDRLTPAERQRFAKEQVAQSLEGTGESVSSAIAGVLTNPWVWLMFLTSPFAGPAVGVVAKGLPAFSVKKQFSAWSKRTGVVGLAHALGLSTASQLVDGTPMPAVMHQVLQTIVKGDDTVARWISPSLLKVLKAASEEAGEELRSLDPAMARTVKGKQVVNDINVALHTHRTGMGLPSGYRKDVVEERVSVYMAAGRDVDGNYVWTTLKAGDPHPLRQGEVISDHPGHPRTVFEQLKKEEKIRRDLWIRQGNRMQDYEPEFVVKELQELPEIINTSAIPSQTGGLLYSEQGRAEIKQILERFHLKEYEAARDTAVKRMGAQLLGDWKTYAETGRFVLDEQKAYKLFQSIGDVAGMPGAPKGQNPYRQGLALLEKIFEVPMTKGLTGSRLGHHEAVSLLKQYYEPAMNGKYLGANLVRQVKVEGVELARDILTDLEFSPLYTRATGRAVGLTSDRMYFDPEMLRYARQRFGGNEGFERLAEIAEAEGLVAAQQGKAFLVHQIAPFKSDEKYFRETVRSYAGFVQDLDEEVLRAQDQYLPYADPKQASMLRLPQSLRPATAEFPEGFDTEAFQRNGQVPAIPYNESWLELRKPERALARQLLPGFSDDPAKAISPMMAFKYSVDLIPDAHVREQARTLVQDAVFGNTTMEHTVSKVLHSTAKQAMASFASGSIGRAIRSSGDFGRRFIEKVEEYADPDRTPLPGGGFSGQLAKYLYVTHLGLNLGSVALNLFQPMLLAGGITGLQHVIPAYVDAFKEMGAYVSKRVSRYGVTPITEAQRMELVRETFKYAGKATAGHNLVQIGGDVFHNIDSFIQVEKGAKKAGLGELLVFELPMKMFEKSEWFVRNVAAHAMGRVYQTAKQSTQSARFFADTMRLVAETQYASSPLNTPRAFMQGILSNPLVRQFLTFPVRTFTQAAVFTPIMLNRNWTEGFAKTFLSGMGISALVYEAGKGGFGVDLSNALYWKATTDILGGSRITDQQGDVLPVPPFIDIPADFIRGVATDDLRLVRDSLWRTLPAGIAAKRLLGTLPQMPVLGALQPSYANWGQVDDQGRVPVFSADGSLVEMRSPSRLVYRALGVDLGSWNDSGELDGYLVKQRDQIAKYRHDYLRALGANDIAKAQAIAAEFGRRYRDPVTKKPLPLTVNESQLKAYLTSQTVTRTERVLDRMDPAARMQFQRMVGATGTGLNLQDPRQLVQEPTAGRREREVGASISKEKLQRLADEARLPASTEETGRGYSPFTGFSGF